MDCARSLGDTEQSLRALVRRHGRAFPTSGVLEIRFHENTCTMVSLSRRGDSRTLRLHRLFTRAPVGVLEAVVKSFMGPHAGEAAQSYRARILDFIDENRPLTLSRLSAQRLRPPRGRAYDLGAVARRLRSRYLASCPAVRIGWSERVTPSLMGKWIAMPAGLRNVIVINRLLDNSVVPPFYLEYIVFHEMLHELIPIRRERGRWIHHPAEFRRRERQFPGYERAQRWERENIADLFDAYLGEADSAGANRIPARPRRRPGWR